MPARKLPDTSVLRRWLRQGKTQQEMADLILKTTGEQVSRASIAVAIHRAGLEKRRPRYKEFIPWTVRAEHAKQYPAVMLRAYERSKEGTELDRLPKDIKTRLMAWLAMLEEDGRVVNYDPEEGFTYVKRRAGDNIIRRPGRQPRQRRAS